MIHPVRFYPLSGIIDDVDLLETMVNNLPIKIEDLISLIQIGCSSNLNMKKIEVLIMLLSKLYHTNKWTLGNLDKSIVNALANVLENVLVNSQANHGLATKSMETFCKLVQINQDLGQSMTATHLSLACNAGYESIVSILVELDGKHSSNFKKWQLNNMEKLPIFKTLVNTLLKVTFLGSRSPKITK